MERVEFDHAGVFVYSPEAGTRAARLTGRPGRKSAQNRRAALLELQKEISGRKLKRMVGRTLPVMIEGPHPETDLLLSGRLPTQAPEVDGSVIITSCQVAFNTGGDEPRPCVGPGRGFLPSRGARFERNLASGSAEAGGPALAGPQTGPPSAGEICHVRITASHDYDLEGIIE
jgi:hypothetical protein